MRRWLLRAGRSTNTDPKTALLPLIVIGGTTGGNADDIFGGVNDDDFTRLNS